MIGQRGGQHRQDTGREVNGSAALERGCIERGPRPYVIAHVRNRHDEPEALAMWLRIDGIIEVARVLAVDGDERQIAQIDSSGRLSSVHAVAERLRLPERCGGKLARQIEFGDGRLGGELDWPIRIEALLYA